MMDGFLSKPENQRKYYSSCQIKLTKTGSIVFVVVSDE